MMTEREDWLEYLDKCDEMLLDEKYSFANDTLQGIRDWISEHQHVTDRQKEAIDNIEGSVQ
jgi:uncharacterized coiled-coil protein SlyX